MIANLVWALAGAVASATFAWWMTWDFLGETLRLALVFTLGGALAGLLVGRFATRSLAPVTGETAGIASGAASLAAGLWAGVWVARNPMLQSAGAIPWWPDALSLVLLVATATFAAIGLGSGIALAIGLVRRARGAAIPGRTIGRLAAATLAAVAIGYSGMSFPMAPLGRLLWNLQFADRVSPWYENREKLFNRVLDGTVCEVLVVPPEASGTSLDRVGRELIARHLGAAIADGTGMCVADIDLVHRALGEQKRRFEWDHVYRLADRIRARWIVRGDAALGTGNWSLRLMSYRRTAPGQPWDAVANLGWDALPVSDDKPPELPIILQAAALPAQLGFTVRTAAAAASTVAPDDSVPPSPARLADGGEHPWTRAERLQLVALMIPPDFNEADDLWARSLVALRHAPSGEERTRILAARAWLMLHRRPYAEQLVDGLPSVEAQLVRARIRGNLTGASRLLAGMPEGLSRLVASLEVERLRGTYSDTAGFEGRWRAIAKSYPGYVPYLSRALASGAWFYDGIEQAVAEELERAGVTLSPPWWTEVARLAVRFALHVDLRDAFVPEVSGRIEAAYGDIWLEHAARWRAPANDQVAARDLMEVLFMVNRSLARDRFVTRAKRQGQEERAFSEALSLPVELRRMPLMLSAATLTGRTVGGETPTPSQRSLRWGAFRISQLLFQTEDGETPVAEAIVEGGHHFHTTVPDEPMRPWRITSDLPVEPEAWRDPSKLRVAQAHFGRASRLTDTDFEVVRPYYYALANQGRETEAEEMLRNLGDRFEGDWYRLEFERQRVQELVDVPARLAGVQRLRRGWERRWSLQLLEAQTLAMDDDVAAADRTLESWPGFAGTDDIEGGPYIANRAEDAAELLLRVGNESAARLMAERSAGQESGAASESTARRLVAALDRRWSDAAGAEIAIHDAYQSYGSLSRAAWYARIGGDLRRAASLRQRAKEDQLGITGRAFAADLQMRGATMAQVFDAIAVYRATGDEDADALFRSRWLFSTIGIDRELDTATAEKVRVRLAQDPHGLLLRLFKAREFAAAGNPQALVDLLEPEFGDVRAKPAYRQGLGTGYMLPYLVLGLAQTGRTGDAPPLLAVWRQRNGGIDPYERAADAMLEAVAGRHDRAVRALWHGFVVVGHDSSTSFPPELMLLELAEHWYRRSGDDRYRAFMVKVSRLTQNLDPYPWAFAFEARYTTDVARRVEATAATLYLDPQSKRLAAVPSEILEAAKRRLESSNPLLVKR